MDTQTNPDIGRQEPTYELRLYDLSDLFETPEKAEQARLALEDASKPLAQRFEQGLTLENINDFLDPYLSLVIDRLRLLTYVELQSFQDVTNTEAKAFGQRVQQTSRAFGQTVASPFFSWWSSLPKDEANTYLEQINNQDLVLFLKANDRFDGHILPLADEQQMIQQHAKVQDLKQERNALIKTLPWDPDGQGYSQKDINKLRSDSDRETRLRAQEIHKMAFGSAAEKFGAIFIGIAEQWYYENCLLRKYDSPIAARNIDTQIPDGVVTELLDAALESLPIFHRYWRLKKKALGLEQFSYEDIGIPLDALNKPVDYGQTMNEILEVFKNFSPEFYNRFKKALDQGHVGLLADPNKVQQGRTFQAVPSVTPFLHGNWNGRMNNALTGAHEASHVVHYDVLNENHHPFGTFWPPSIMEVPSLIGERQFIHYKLGQAQTDPEMQKALLFYELDQAFEPIMHLLLARFEIEAHNLVIADYDKRRKGQTPSNGEPSDASSETTTDQLCNLYLTRLKEWYGPDVHVPDECKYEWLSYPQFTNPFSNYAYGFGLLVGLAVSEKCAQDPQMIPHYIELLNMHGSIPPPEALKATMGIDIAEQGFWRKRIEYLNGLCAQLEVINAAAS